ncbi:MAG: hypothetical protein HPY69_03870 [Armatimonadetes bacterium]|nr:hypothetical protein [Armatimonadota bacterium]
MQDSQLQTLERQSWHGVEQDGLTDVCLGLLLALMGLALSTHAGVMVLVVVLQLLMVRALGRLRRRWTEPRVGYVRLREQPPAKLLGGVALWVVMVTVVLAAVLVALRGAPPGITIWRQWMPLWVSLLVSGGFIHAAGRSGLWRYHLYTAAALVSGLVFSLLPASGPYGNTAAHLLVLALATVVTGGISFLLFLRRHPVVEVGEPHAE